jgi:type III restriction enzyme
LKIQFESNQSYQLDAVNAVADLFDGQPRARGQYEVNLVDPATALTLFNELGVANDLVLDDDAILRNVQTIQARNELAEKYRVTELQGRNFSIEMETGTGKTYVYLRTVYELHARYGFTKFIIVVPSIAIREGVMKNLEITRDHFAALYGNPPRDAWIYDAKQVSRLQGFARANQIQILVINIDAFNKRDSAVIYKESDRFFGRQPIESIQATRPIVILDEPQNMESELAQKAIANLNPLCTLRYSATHRTLYNLLYRLTPVAAYDLDLVKRIEVDSVIEESDFNAPFIALDSVKATANKITARLRIDIQGPSGPQRKALSISKSGVDLFDLSGGRESYRGYIVDDIHAGDGYISFTNGTALDQGQSIGGHHDDVMRVQVCETVKQHLDKERALLRQRPAGGRLKVLSLFFIDRVANYADVDGKSQADRKIRNWFVEAYTELAAKPLYKDLNLPPVEVVHNGYFAQSKGKPKDTNGTTKDDDDAYQLIMRDKERLLSLDEPLRFIFSHSALREGWDNPNVFQICTLNETRSDVKKRQEIGRGMRLPVDETGNRVFDREVNRLTVIANESYNDFARALQQEIEEETGEQFDRSRIGNTRERRHAQLKPNWRLDPDFQALWDRIKGRTRYAVQYDTADLIARASEALRAMPPIVEPRIITSTRGLNLSERGVTTVLLSGEREAAIEGVVTALPDILGYLQHETELTRGTLAAILTASGRLPDVLRNPQQFLDAATRAIRATLDRLMISGIKYERLSKVEQPDDAEFGMWLFEEKEINGYASRMVEVSKSIYDVLEYDSAVESQFARDLDSRPDIKLFIKLPNWFKIETPIGTYNPDWAIVKDEDGEEKLYLVRETKSTCNLDELRRDEADKIRCGIAHFATLGVNYKVVTEAAKV